MSEATATIDFAPVVERIRKECSNFRAVDFAMSFEAIKERGVPALPCAFVLPSSEKASANKLGSGGVHNQVRFAFQVYTLVKFAGDTLGGKAVDLLKRERDPLHQALLAWSVPGADSPTEFARAGFVAFMNGTLVWYDQFEFDGFYRRVP